MAPAQKDRRYYHRITASQAHADVIVGKFIKGFPTDEGMEDCRRWISPPMYLDQIPDNDIGLQVSKEYDIPVYQSIPAALCLGGRQIGRRWRNFHWRTRQLRLQREGPAPVSPALFL